MTLPREIAALFVTQLLLVGTGPAAAADWIVQAIAGSALALDNEQWVVLDTGDVLAEPFTLRTLGRAQVSVGTTDAALSIRSFTTATVSAESSLVTVELLQGAVSALVQNDRRALISAGRTQVDLAAGSAEIEMTAGSANVRSRDGLVTVRDPAAQAPVLLAPGSSANPAELGNDSPTSQSGSGNSQGGGGGNGSGEVSASEGRANSSEAVGSDDRGHLPGRP